VLAQGLFQTPGRRPVVMRVSTLPGDIHDDQVSTPRGLAVKLFDVAGERLPGAGLLAR
jgi:catalase